MFIGFGNGWGLSINLNKGSYSSCLNPHVGFGRRGHPNTWIMKTFKPGSLFDIEMDTRRLAHMRKQREEDDARRFVLFGAKRIFNIGVVSQFAIVSRGMAYIDTYLNLGFKVFRARKPSVKYKSLLDQHRSYVGELRKYDYRHGAISYPLNMANKLRSKMKKAGGTNKFIKSDMYRSRLHSIGAN